ncbi:MAG: DUF5662 family protein [Eubacteriales bacterium]|nr:DUF5662 family protein [Eubacteriales bacterium]
MFFDFEGKSIFERFFGHIKTVHVHKKHVRDGCFKIGLYRQGIMHDLSKYSPTEFFLSVKYWCGTRSPNANDRRINGCSRAWLHHKGRNRHHFEYWIDFEGPPVNGFIGCKMPLKYVAEMVCDRRAACIAYHGKDYKQADAWNYYARNRKILVMHPDTRAVLERALILMRDESEEACFEFLRSILKITKGSDYTAGSLGIEYSDLDQ